MFCVSIISDCPGERMRRRFKSFLWPSSKKNAGAKKTTEINIALAKKTPTTTKRRLRYSFFIRTLSSWVNKFIILFFDSSRLNPLPQSQTNDSRISQGVSKFHLRNRIFKRKNVDPGVAKFHSCPQFIR